MRTCIATAAAALLACLSPTLAGPIAERNNPESAQDPGCPEEPGSEPELLDKLAKEDGKLYFGTAVDSPSYNDTKYNAVRDTPGLFGQLTAANAMKWESTEPTTRGEFDFAPGDYLVSIAKNNNQIVRCHTLVWHNQLPTWLTSGTWDNETLTSILENHITNLVTHFGSDCYAWDVVNEAFNEDGTYRETLWYNVTGTSYLFNAFAFAQKAAEDAGHPEIKLYYNDYNIERPSNKSAAAARLAQDIQARGIKIDGMGLQSHFVNSRAPTREEQVTTMRSYTALGLEVAITELDIRFENATRGTTANATAQAVQAGNYKNAAGACHDVEECVGVTLWDFTDKYSWIPGVFEGQGAANPWDENVDVKPVVYQGIADGITGAE